MFSQDQDKYADVIITTTDGSEIEGRLLCGMSGLIDSALNTDHQFVQLKDQHNDTSFIAKTYIARLAPKKSAHQTMPVLNVNMGKAGNWSEILGVDRNSTPEEVKQAYHNLAKAYHPDMFSIDMPLEIKNYASTMLSRFNVAYEQYKSFGQAA